MRFIIENETGYIAACPDVADGRTNQDKHWVEYWGIMRPKYTHKIINIEGISLPFISSLQTASENECLSDHAWVTPYLKEFGLLNNG